MKKTAESKPAVHIKVSDFYLKLRKLGVPEEEIHRIVSILSKK